MQSFNPNRIYQTKCSICEKAFESEWDTDICPECDEEAHQMSLDNDTPMWEKESHWHYQAMKDAGLIR